MEDSYVIKTAFKMGENDEKYGQTWYCTVEELQVPVMLNLLNGDLQELDKITPETQEIQKFKSGKNAGKEYRRFKKVKITQGTPRAAAPASSDIEERLRKLEAVVFPSGEEEVPNTPAPVEKAPPLTNEDAPINLDDIPF